MSIFLQGMCMKGLKEEYNMVFDMTEKLKG